MPADRFTVEFECENHHWVGVTSNVTVTPGHPGTVKPPTKCPHPECGAPLYSLKRTRKKPIR